MPLIDLLNETKLLHGLALVIHTVAGKHIVNELPSSIQNVFNTPFARKLLVFGAAFLATKDIMSSLLFTLLFVIVFRVLLNPESKGCIMRLKKDYPSQPTTGPNPPAPNHPGFNDNSAIAPLFTHIN